MGVPQVVNVETVNAVYARLENRPGTLERAARALGERRLNIDTVSLDTNGNVGFARFLTPRSKDAVEALRSAGIEAWESQAVVATLPNRPNELAQAAREVAAAGVNIEAVATTADGRLAFRTSDNERAAMILRKM